MQQQLITLTKKLTFNLVMKIKLIKTCDKIKWKPEAEKPAKHQQTTNLIQNA